METEKRVNRDWSIQAAKRYGQGNQVEFMLDTMSFPVRVRGLMLWGTHPSSVIQSLQLANQELVCAEPVPAFIFERTDIPTLEEANQLLEQGSFAMLRRQSMEGVLEHGCRARVIISGACAGAAFLCEVVARQDLLEKKVSIKKDKGGYYGSVSRETLYGEVTTLSIAAETEQAAVDAIVAELGGGRIYRDNRL